MAIVIYFITSIRWTMNDDRSCDIFYNFYVTDKMSSVCVELNNIVLDRVILESSKRYFST